MNLDRAWYTAGTNAALWGKAGTYKRIPFDALPPIAGPLDGKFKWLTEATQMSPYGMQFGSDGEELDEAPTKVVSARGAEAKKAGLRLPAAFEKFTSDMELGALIPSCTACYFEIGARLIEIPDHQGPERLLRFMHDQQTCFVWYLLLEPGGAHRVVIASPEFTDNEDATSFEDAAIPRDILVCSDSFEEFIKRWWIENSIWFAAQKSVELTGELAAYARAAQAAIASGAVSAER